LADTILRDSVLLGVSAGVCCRCRDMLRLRPDSAAGARCATSTGHRDHEYPVDQHSDSMYCCARIDGGSSASPWRWRQLDAALQQVLPQRLHTAKPQVAGTADGAAVTIE
jgi:hypothetical protein